MAQFMKNCTVHEKLLSFNEIGHLQVTLYLGKSSIKSVQDELPSKSLENPENLLQPLIL